MAKTLIVKITCDRCRADGKGDEVPGEESVSFAYDGFTYGLDLCAEHAAEFHDVIQGLIGVAAERERIGAPRRVRATATGGAPAPVAGVAPAKAPARRDKEQLQAIRDWANANGFKVSNRGRIPAEVEDAYQASFRRVEA
ncbi:MAG: Lsr2 family protein [Acidimicrobiia bacterium]|nr:Lsr2 family protein [Acidimicrobiia bacterium]